MNRHFSVTMLAKSGSPRVLIFGWLGSKDIHMNIIKRFYDEVQIPSKYLIQSPSSLLGIHTNQKKVEDIRKYASDGPVMCHIFSLNGFSAFYKTLADENLRIRKGIDVKGFILDSTPSHVTHDVYYRAFSNALFPKSQTMQGIASIGLRPLFDLFLLFARKHRKEAAWQTDYLYNNPFLQPQLIIGSMQDEILMHDEIKRYAEAAIKAGAPVETKYYPDSGHIRLYKDHRPEYKQLVTNFAKKVLYPNGTPA